MLKILALFVIANVFVYGQLINNVRVINHREYMVAIIRETMKVVEERQWCNLKLQDITQEVAEEIVHWNMNGTIRYTNGFVISIQHLDILQSSLNQIWSNTGDGTVTVEIRGQLRITNIALGYDVTADLNNGMRHYTGSVTHPLITFDFSLFRNVHTNDIRITVRGNHPRILNTMDFLPYDRYSDAMVSLYDWNSTFYGVTAWGQEVFEPIALDVIHNVVEYPGLCYNCPAT